MAEAPPPPPPPPMSLTVTGVAVIKVQSSLAGIAMLEEKPTSLFETGPDRRLVFASFTGAVSGTYSPPDGWLLIDFAQHPSGEVTATIAAPRQVRLVRLDRTATVRANFALTDAQVANDPFYDDGGRHDDTSMLPYYTGDAVRVAAVGEHLAVALRTGRNALVAYRFNYGSDGFVRAWRTLAEPGLTMFPRSVTSGSYDAFGQLDNHWRVFLDADAAGNIAVASVSNPIYVRLFPAHADYFRQPIDAVYGALVTRIAANGQRLGATVVDTAEVAEVHGVRMAGGDVAVFGRVYSDRRPDGGGWNAYVARVGFADGGLRYYRLLDVDRGDVVFDAAPLAQGRLLVAGATGYTQNPTGASISEDSAPLLAVLEADGTLKARVAVPAGARHNQLRSLAARDGNWLVGGMVNGPGTHSADGNPAALTADGVVRELTVGQ